MHDLKQAAREIFLRTLAAADPKRLLPCRLRRCGSRLQWQGGELDLGEFRRIFVIAVGKAAEAMTEPLLALLPEEPPREGILVTPTPPQSVPAHFQMFVAGHPVPNQQSFLAARAVLRLLQRADARTLVFFLLSGGGSALLELPVDERIPLEEVQELHRLLVGCGAAIEEINRVRKHLSAVKGGRLAAMAPEAYKLTLAVSDVPIGQEAALASGPTLPDPSTWADVWEVIERYELLPRLPATIRQLVTSGALPETPKADLPAFRRATFLLLVDSRDLLHRAHQAAESLGFHALCDNSTDNWPLERAAEWLLHLLQAEKSAHPERPVAVVADGEVLCPVRGPGRGGRNSAFVLYCVPRVAGQSVAVLRAGTDGIDGSSPAAGAVADGQSLERARRLGLDPEAFFSASDSFTFFERLGDAVLTGPTGNNLRDLCLLLHA